ncbi:hypothetical protein NDU88_002442 [Pleurodeles waltl]|uniref:Myb/SANT-like DNA-binding domain-containing protein n=1 Tax=Pleurodeles waltl TaxID=8319 RepID=A0AAV7TLT2_PLEWA|nr:hypothetical protein NDU88_002442 [Pleurodeles waltl]
MAAATGERAPAFTSEELEKLVDGVLPQYALLYGPPDQQVSAHQKVDIWRAIAKDIRTLGVHNRRGTHCRKRWEDIRRGSRKTAEALLGMASQRRRDAMRQLTPLMSRILAVAYPDLDGRVRTSQQTQGASSGGGEVALEHEGAASHMAPEGHATDSDLTSETEGEGGSTTGTRGGISDTDTSSEGSSLVVAATSVPTATTGTAATQRTSSALPAAPQRSHRARSHIKAGISFAPGTSGPAPVTPAALSEEVIDLLRTLIVGQSTLLNAIQGVEREVHRSNAYLEGIHSATSASSKGTASPPPGKKTKKAKGWREKTETAASTGTTLAPSGSGVPPGTSPKGGKGHRGSGKDGKGSTADKSGSRRAAQEGPTSPIPGVKEDTHGHGPPAQEGPASEKSDGE